MTSFQREIFGPVMLCMEAETLEEAIDLVNENKCMYIAPIRSPESPNLFSDGNGSIFRRPGTSSYSYHPDRMFYFHIQRCLGASISKRCERRYGLCQQPPQCSPGKL
jgi:hypothetical protein